MDHPEVQPMGGPDEWTAETLKTAWYQHKLRQYHSHLLNTQFIPQSEWAAFTQADAEAPKEDYTVTEILKGIWRIEGNVWVVEGECPVSVVDVVRR